MAGVSWEDEGLRRKLTAAIPEVAAKEYSATWQQAQFLSTNAALEELLRVDQSPTVRRLVSETVVAERVQLGFRLVFGRPPDEEEQQRSVEFMAARGEDVAGAVRDFLWALVTSAEFLTVP
jgi:hypothetical protein